MSRQKRAPLSDRFGVSQVLGGALLMGALSLLDGVLTMAVIHAGGEELSPLMSWWMAEFPHAWLGQKVFICAACGGVLSRAPRAWFAGAVLLLAACLVSAGMLV